MALLTQTAPSVTGATPTYNAVTASDTVFIGANPVMLVVRNASASPITATVVIPGSTYGQANPDVVVSVPATTGERWIGPLTKAMDDTTDGNPNQVVVQFSATTSVTCAVLAL